MIAASAALLALLFWWAGTGAVLAAAHRPPGRSTLLFAGSSLGLVAALAVLTREPAGQDPLVTFLAVFAIWAWIELSFYTGFVTGPRRTAPPPGTRGWPLLRCALEASAHHELAMAALWLVVTGLTLADPQHFASVLLAVLILLHTSARLNVLLGVRNLNEHFLPAHLEHLKPYFTQRAGNPLLPLSVLVGSLATAWAAAAAFAAVGDARVRYALLAALLGIGVAEHLLLVAPLPAHRLWSWSLPGRGKAGRSTP
ncbi:MAG: DUF3623 family protein [Gemmatimonadetes bacterium]|nr:DUF3623 family protein [Gemmatimonadota bacterium]